MTWEVVVKSGLCACGCGERTNLAPYTSEKRGWAKGEPVRFVHGHHPRGQKQSPEHIEKRIGPLRGEKRGPLSAEHRAKIGAAGKGKVISQEVREKIGAAQRGELNHIWKGDSANYATKHSWMLRNFTKTGTCELCRRTPPKHKRQKTGTHWANRNHRYNRDVARVREDWIELCAKCHSGYDKARRNGSLPAFIASVEVEKPEAIQIVA